MSKGKILKECSRAITVIRKQQYALFHPMYVQQDVGDKRVEISVCNNCNTVNDIVNNYDVVIRELVNQRNAIVLDQNETWLTIVDVGKDGAPKHPGKKKK